VPFTGSHPAAILPFLRSPMPASALVIGSMSPDLPLYLPMPYTVAFSHSVVGAVTVDVIVGVVAYLLWRGILRPFAVDYAPPRIGDRLPPAERSRPHWILASLGMASLTHVVWDAFTHFDGWAVQRVAPLRTSFGVLPAYEWAQYLSGLLGLTVLTVWIVRWRRRTPPVGTASAPPRMRLVVYGFIFAAGLAGAVYGWWYGLGQPDRIRSAFFHSATKGIDAGFIAVLILALGWTIRRRRARQPTEPLLPSR
jgi:hypothetical protein